MAPEKTLIDCPIWYCFACFSPIESPDRVTAILVHCPAHCHNDAAVHTTPAPHSLLGSHTGIRSFAMHQICWALVKEEDADTAKHLWRLALTAELKGVSSAHYDGAALDVMQRSFFDTIFDTPAYLARLADAARTAGQPFESTLLAKTFQLLTQLPPEVVLLVTSYMQPCLAQKVAVVSVHSALHIRDMRVNPQPMFRIAILKPHNGVLYLRWSRFAGQDYVAEVSGDAGPARTRLLLDPDKPIAVLSLDTLGCRGIGAYGKKAVPQAAYYRIVDLDCNAYAHYQGLNLRDITSSRDARHEWLWTTDTPPFLRPESSFTSTSGIQVGSPLMRYHKLPTKLNAISVASFQGNSFLVHLHGEDAYTTNRFYQYAASLGYNFKWLYFPLWDTEQLCQVFVRHTPKCAIGPASIAVTTSFGRSFQFGPYIEIANRPTYEFLPLVHADRPRITGICINDRFLETHGVSPRLVLSVECEPGNNTTVEPVATIRCPTSINEHTSMCTPNFGIYFFEARLTDVLYFQCRMSRERHECCSGLLLTTSQGPVVLGQWQDDDNVSDRISALNGISFTTYRVGGLGCVSVRPGKVLDGDESWLHAGPGSTITWWSADSGDFVDVISAAPSTVLLNST